MGCEPCPDAEVASRLQDEETLRGLMIRYQQADSSAVEELVTRLSPTLFRYLRMPGQPSPEAEDLLQECWLRIHRSRHSYHVSEPVLPWIFAIARHTRIDAYRRKSKRAQHEISVGTLPESVQQPAYSPDRAPDQRLLNAIGQLPASQREVIMMLKSSGMTLEEVARATSSTVGAVKLKAHRAYEKLRRILRPASTQGAI